MKKLIAIVFVVAISISAFVFDAVTASAKSPVANAQINYIKRKSKKVYRRSKHGTKVVYYKTKRGTKKTYYKTKRVTKRTYSKTKDKVTN